MNSKKNKHKKPNKSNQNLPKQEEVDTGTTESSAATESVIDIPSVVPEVVKEEIQAPIEVETPKKPKRNKGKKKKGNETEEVEEEKSADSSVAKKESQIPDKEDKIISEELALPIEPAARKNKNKKKSHEPAIVEDIQAPVPLTPVIEVEEQKIELLSAEVTEESKTSKKKNKKKKRNDSDRSDRNTEEVSSTSAFEIKQEDKIEVQIETQKSDVTNEPSQPSLDDKSNTVTEEQEMQSNQQSDSKNKKKGKKEKKKQADKNTVENIEEKPVAEENITLSTNIPEPPKDEIKSFEVCENIEELLTPDSPKQEIKVEDECKVKPKIAKPVEKKRKGKHEIENKASEDVKSETVIQKEALTPIPEVTPTTPIQEVTPITLVEHIEEGLPKKDITKQKTDISLSTLETAEQKLQEEVIKSFEADKLTESKENVNTKNKKKRKQMKVPENSPEGQIEEKSKQQEQKTTSEVKQSEDLTSSDKNLQIEAKDEILFESLVSSDPTPIIEENLDEIIESISQPDETKDTSETLEPFQDVSSRKKKKGRKSPKPLTQTDESKKETVLESSPIEQKKEAQTQEKPVSLKLPEDVPKSRKSETPCVTPEIQYPRSTSQQFDSNNNMVIRELLQEDASNIPILPTNIQGSGETPIGTPQMISSDIKITEIESPSKVEEKTDLKSKMMEVNQDMEELRMSIERSLAELTSMEDTENKIEKQYEEKRQTETIALPVTTVDLNIVQQTDPPKLLTEEKIETTPTAIPATTIGEDKNSVKSDLAENQEDKLITVQGKTDPKTTETCTEPAPPVCPARKDNKGKGKKRKGKDTVATVSQAPTTTTTTSAESEKKDSKEQKGDKTQEKSDNNQAKGKQKSDIPQQDKQSYQGGSVIESFEAIDDFEDALSTVDDQDVNKSFEMILKEVNEENQRELADNKPEIKITGPDDTKKTQNVPQPKNLLGHPNIPVLSNRTDYKKEKNKPPNTKQAKVKIKDSNDIEKDKNKKPNADLSKINESFSQINQSEDFIYKYSFRKVFLQSSCVVCKKDLTEGRVPCKLCSLVFYCSKDHCSTDWRQHKDFCNAIKMTLKSKDLSHTYSNAQGVAGHSYRLLRMEMILACEKELKRRLVPWEQEALLYPRMCADVWCRKAEQETLKDCEGCGQISYCADTPDHLPKTHQRWCKSYALYQKLVTHQQTKGRLQLKMPTKIMPMQYQVPQNMNEVLASMYEEKIDMTDIQYAALTQIATAPLTALYSYQLVKNTKKITNGLKKHTNFTIHVVGAELQFEADMLNKWEVFFLHLKPDVKDLRVVLIGMELNPGNLPLELLGKIRMCEDCRSNKRRLLLTFCDKTTYSNYKISDDFITPDIVCAYNPAINRSSVYNGNDPWPSTLTAISRLKVPFLVTAHTITELQRDLVRVKECCEVKVLGDPKHNPFASVRPDRNFISDDETPLLFKNQCFMILNGF